MADDYNSVHGFDVAFLLSVMCIYSTLLLTVCILTAKTKYTTITQYKIDGLLIPDSTNIPSSSPLHLAWLHPFVLLCLASLPLMCVCDTLSVWIQ